MRLMGAMTWHAYVQLNPCPRVESKMPDYLEKYQRKIKEDDEKDDKPIQGMINTIIRILNYVATFLQLVLQHLSQCCLLYTSPSPRDGLLSRMPSSA